MSDDGYEKTFLESIARVILAAHSKYFDRAFSNGMQETEARSINLSSDGIAVVSRLHNFFYHFDYNNEWDAEEEKLASYSDGDEEADTDGKSVLQSSHGDSSRDPTQEPKIGTLMEALPFVNEIRTGTLTPPAGSLRLNARMYVIGDKYAIQGLQQLAFDYCEKIVESYTFGKDKASMKVIASEIADAVQELYENTSTTAFDSNLKDLICQKAFDEYKYLIGTARFQELLDEVPAFCRDMLSLMTAEHVEPVYLSEEEVASSDAEIEI
ncbi:MAG: hypothetical protein M1814_003977 [Vezdaea aestivalis]|nr:MAG: hypothetical protein M1814_003977 [Vezdaea aestivalis]